MYNFEKFIFTEKTNVNKFPISSQTALILGMQAPRSYFRLTCEYEHYTLKFIHEALAKFCAACHAFTLYVDAWKN